MFGVHGNLRTRHTGELRCVTDMIAVAVGDEDEVHLAELGEIFQLLRCLRILRDEWVDHDDFPARGRDLEGGMAEPLQFESMSSSSNYKRRPQNYNKDQQRQIFFSRHESSLHLKVDFVLISPFVYLDKGIRV
jgi:hypothetical protein